ncbi:MAG: ABC transporter permease [Candidatus Acidiferrum sp.]|jgi:lipopolysaccharide transport system permease protein
MAAMNTPLPATRSESILNFEFITDFWHYRELLYFLAWREVKVRYKQAALGAAWAIIQPLFTMIIFTLFFGRLAGVPSDGIPYPLFSFCALVPWTYFAGTLSLAGNSLVSNANLVTKVYFPRVLLPAATVISGMLDFVIGSVFLFFMMIYYHVRPGWNLLFVPIFVINMMVLALGISMLLAAINVRYRDVKYALPFIIQIWLFVTPIIYPVTFVPARYQKILALNPMAGIVEGLRACLFSTRAMPWKLIEISWAVTLALLIGGALYFRKTERTFADIV